MILKITTEGNLIHALLITLISIKDRNFCNENPVIPITMLARMNEQTTERTNDRERGGRRRGKDRGETPLKFHFD